MLETALPVLGNVAAGAATGIAISVGGYWKNSGENFDAKQTLQTALIGGVIGGLGGFMGLTYEHAASYLTNAGFIVGVNYGVKGFMRRVYPKISGWFNRHFPSAPPS